MDNLLKRVNAIAVATGNDEEKGDVTGGVEIDEFTRIKREINLEIREIRNDIKYRDEFADSFAGKNDQTEIAKKSAAIMVKIKELKGRKADLVKLVNQEEAKLRKKNQDVKTLDSRKKMCDLIEAHIEEVDRWSKGRSLVKQRDDPNKATLLKGAKLGFETAPNPGNFIPSNATETELEEVDGIDEELMQIRETEQVIDQQLDQLLDSTQKIKTVAARLGEEYRVLGGMLDEAEDKMDKTSGNLESANDQLAEVTKAVGGCCKNCCLDILLIVAILGCVYYILARFVL